MQLVEQRHPSGVNAAVSLMERRVSCLRLLKWWLSRTDLKANSRQPWFAPLLIAGQDDTCFA